MKPVFKTFVEDKEITAPKSGWKPIEQKTVIENFNSDKKYSFKTLKEVLVEQKFISESEKQDKVLVEEVIEDNKEVYVETEINAEEIVEEEPSVIEEKSLIDKASEYITKRSKLEEADSFQQPVAPNIPNNLADINKRVRYLEQWLAKVSMDGPGSGEVRFLNLDDVDRASIADRDTHKLLRYKPDSNPAFDSVYFDFLSGDQGEIYSLKYNPYTGYTANANVAPGLTYYDPERDTLEILHKDGNATYAGLDNYIRVINNGTGITIPKGSLVQFAGVEQANLIPYVSLFTANSLSTPLYVIGLMANDLPPNTIGRAMLLGELEDFNTTGNVVGEVWQTGDLLWAHPSLPGKLTKVKPTAPNVVVSVAAVLNANATSGHLLVRPTIWPRLRAGEFYSPNPQTAPNTNFGHQLTISNVIFSSTVSLANSEIKVGESGLYYFSLRAQLASSSASQKSIVLWYKKNNVNVPFSTTIQTVAVNGAYSIITNNQMISLTPQDNVKVFFAVTDTTLSIDSPAPFGGSANVPAVQITVTEPSL